MAEPKKKLSRTRRGSRRSHDAVKARSLAVCLQCKTPKLPHIVCPSCGYYKGKQVIKKV